MFNNKSVYNKINITVALLIVFILVLATNRIDKRHFDTAQSTLIAVHDDRVVAQDYLFKMVNSINQQQLDLVTNSNPANYSILNSEIRELIELYATTKLTSKEAKIYNRLQGDFSDLEKLNNTVDQQKQITRALNTLKADVDQLALLQVTESRQLTNMAQKSLDMNSLLSKIELVFLVIIVLFIQFIVFHKVKNKDKHQENIEKPN